MQKEIINPFLRWIGGKTRKIKQFQPFYPLHLKKYHYFEIFLGSGSFLFHFQPSRAIINDINPHLINAYIIIKNSISELLELLKIHDNHDIKQGKEYYEEIKSEFNSNKGNDIEKASYFLYINARCFNGIFRVNSKGEFNVSYANKEVHRTKNIYNEINLKNVSRYLNDNDIMILNESYEKTITHIEDERNTFFILDPPYYPLNETSNFTGYVSGGWKNEDFKKLYSFINQLDERKIKFVLHNSYCDTIKNLFSEYNQHVTKIPRFVNVKGDKRQPIKEIVITNYKLKKRPSLF